MTTGTTNPATLTWGTCSRGQRTLKTISDLLIPRGCFFPPQMSHGLKTCGAPAGKLQAPKEPVLVACPPRLSLNMAGIQLSPREKGTHPSNGFKLNCPTQAETVASDKPTHLFILDILQEPKFQSVLIKIPLSC